MVEDVEQLEARFKLHSFGDAGLFGECGVEVRVTRSVKLVAREIAGRVVVGVSERAVAHSGQRLGGNAVVERGSSNVAACEVGGVADEFCAVALSGVLGIAGAPDIIRMSSL